MSLTHLIFDKVRKWVPRVPPEEAAYRRLAEKSFSPRGIIDVGAYQGDWTRLAQRVWPGVPTLMIEAQDAKRSFLDSVCADFPSVSYVSAVLGAADGQVVDFFEMETGSSFMPERSNVARVRRSLTMRTLDSVAGDIPGPILLKIDVQGGELQVLSGGPATLARADVVQLEIALLPYNDGAPTILQVLFFMEEKGFVPFDISGSSRPNGVDLVQIDLLFVPRASPLRQTFFNF